MRRIFRYLKWVIYLIMWMVILTLFFTITLQAYLPRGIGFAFATIALFMDGNLIERFFISLLIFAIATVGDFGVLIIGILAIPLATLLGALLDKRKKRIQAGP